MGRGFSEEGPRAEEIREGELIATTQATVDGVIDQPSPGELEWNATLLEGDIEDSIPKLKETLYLHGGRDGCIALELVLDAARHLAPGSRMLVVEGAGHFLHLEKPNEVSRAILDWIGPA